MQVGSCNSPALVPYWAQPPLEGPMRRLSFWLIYLVLVPGPVSAQAALTPQDTLAYATTSVRLRENPFPTARALALVPQGAAVRLYTCTQGWCSVGVARRLSRSRGGLVTGKTPACCTHSCERVSPAAGVWRFGCEESPNFAHTHDRFCEALNCDSIQTGRRPPKPVLRAAHRPAY